MLWIAITYDADPGPACSFDKDPDPTFHFDADLDPNSTFCFDADLDPDPRFQRKAQNFKSAQLGSYSIHFGLSSAN